MQSFNEPAQAITAFNERPESFAAISNWCGDYRNKVLCADGQFPMNLFQICEIKITYDPKIPASKQPKITSSESAHDVFRAHWKDVKHVESFYILLLNRANHCIGIKHVSTGGLSGTVADPKVIMQTALKANASSLILAHNHPSNDLKPSQNDIDLTKKLKSAGQFLDLQVLDHLILGWETYYSFADEGLI